MMSMAKIVELENPIYLKAEKNGKVYFIIDSLNTIQDRLCIKTKEESMIPLCVQDRWKFDSVVRLSKEQYHSSLKRISDSGFKVRYF